MAILVGGGLIMVVDSLSCWQWFNRQLNLGRRRDDLFWKVNWHKLWPSMAKSVTSAAKLVGGDLIWHVACLICGSGGFRELASAIMFKT